MKIKKSLALLGAVVLSWSTAGFAEVQNVKVGGELRFRANWSKHIQGLGNTKPALPVVAQGRLFPVGAVAAATAVSGTATALDTTTVRPSDDSFGFFETRVQVYVESDLTDNVFARVTLEAEDLSGDFDVANTTTSFTEDRDFDVGIAEAYAELSELFYSPLTVKVGRQYMHFGRGFMVSSNEKEQRFDAARSTFDFYPITVDAWYAKVTETLEFDHDRDFWGVNASYAADNWNAEAYVMGLQDKQVTGVEPVALGVRGDISLVENCLAWGEIVYEDGTFGTHDLNAFAVQLGKSYQFVDCAWMPEVHVEWTFGSGGNSFDDSFIQFFEYNYYGYVFSPVVSNIHILNGGLSVYPTENVRGFFDFYYYRQDERLAQIVGDPFQDNGGVSAATNGTDRDLGVEIDFGMDYQYTEDVVTQMYAGWFFPGDAYSATTNENTAFEVRGELLVNF